MEVKIGRFGQGVVSSNRFNYWLEKQGVNDVLPRSLLEAFAQGLQTLTADLDVGKRPVATEKHLACLVFAADEVMAAGEQIVGQFSRFSPEDRRKAIGQLLAADYLSKNQVPRILFEQYCGVCQELAGGRPEIEKIQDYLTAAFPKSIFSESVE